MLGKRSLEYLVAAYGADKLNAPDQAEPVVQKMIQMDPTEPTNYFALAKIYEDAGAYNEAEQMYLKAKEVRPNDPTVYTTLAGYYNRQGQFDKTIQALEERAAEGADQPRGLPHHRQLLLGRNPRRSEAARQREEGLRPEGPPGVRQGHPAQARLRGCHRLQGPPAAPAGASREGPWQAERAHRRGQARSARRPTSCGRSRAPASASSQGRREPPTPPRRNPGLTASHVQTKRPPDLGGLAALFACLRGASSACSDGRGL